MYIPTHFNVDDSDTVLELMANYPLATLVTQQADGLVANPIPMIAELKNGQLHLKGHVARSNPVWKLTELAPKCLTLFQGAQGYISPQWYAAKAVDGKVVPTWNYQAVHCHGELVIHDDPLWLRGLLTSLTDIHERVFETPWSITDAPADYVEKMLKAIVGIEVVVTQVEAKFKLSQNKSVLEMKNIVAGLEAMGDVTNNALAQAMTVEAKKL